VYVAINWRVLVSLRYESTYPPFSRRRYFPAVPSIKS
jgi:hypothetical protein